MAKKLKNLRIRKVDFVDEGANPDAHTRLTKKRDGGQPAGEGSGKGTGALHRLFSLIGKAAGMDQDEIDSAMDEIQKGSSMSFTERINAVNTGKIADEIWDICYALQSSFCSILNDEDLDSAGAAAAMQESLDEFYGVVKESVSKWSNGKVASITKRDDKISEAELQIMKSAVERLNESIEKATLPAVEPDKNGPGNHENPKGEEEMGMKIDKSKLTDAEKAFLESIEKRYGTEEETVPGSGGTPATQAPAGQSAPPTVPGSGGQSAAPAAAGEPTVTKSLEQPAAGTAPVPQAEEPDSIYKGLHPAVRAELEGLKKFREDAEARELTEVAKKYAIIGKKEEELVPLFRSLKAAGGTAYNDMVAVLDQAVATVEKSGAFSEIGKSGHGSTDGSAWAEAEAKATELMKSKTGLSRAQALDEVFMSDPELAAKCEKEE